MDKYLLYNDFVRIAEPIANNLMPRYDSPSSKFTNHDFLFCLVDFAKKGIHWCDYMGPPEHPVKGKYLNSIHNRYIKLGVYEEIDKCFLEIYLKKGKEKKLKNQIIDSSFIRNKGGSIKNNNHLLSNDSKKKNKKIKKENILHPNNKKKEETFIDNNKYNGRKKYFKVSAITDSFGVPLAGCLISSKQSDNISIKETINKIPIEINTKRNSKINRYKQNFLADAGYHSSKNINYLRKLGYQPIINYNKRNTKNKNKIKKNEFTKKEKEIYKKRIIIESTFSWIKNYPSINQNYQKKLESYNGLLLLVFSIIRFKKSLKN